jgi:hypothetical protein
MFVKCVGGGGLYLAYRGERAGERMCATAITQTPTTCVLDDARASGRGTITAVYYRSVQRRRTQAGRCAAPSS